MDYIKGNQANVLGNINFELGFVLTPTRPIHGPTFLVGFGTSVAAKLGHIGIRVYGRIMGAYLNALASQIIKTFKYSRLDQK